MKRAFRFFECLISMKPPNCLENFFQASSIRMIGNFFLMVPDLLLEAITIQSMRSSDWCRSLRWCNTRISEILRFVDSPFWGQFCLEIILDIAWFNSLLGDACLQAWGVMIDWKLKQLFFGYPLHNPLLDEVNLFSTPIYSSPWFSLPVRETGAFSTTGAKSENLFWRLREADAGEHTWVDRGHRPVDAQVINRGISCMLQVGWFVRMLCCVIAKMLENSIPVPHSQKMISLWKGAIFINHPTTVLGPSEFGLELSRAKQRRLSVSGRFGCFSKTRYPSILWTLSDCRNPFVFVSALWETANFEVFEVQ